MNPIGRALVAAVCVGVTSLRAADPAAVDYTQRNAPFAPARSVLPEVTSPSVNPSVQQRRVDADRVEKPAAAVGDRRAPLSVQETRDKRVQPKDSQRAQPTQQPMSALNQRPASVSTADPKRPPMVSKYQDSLAAASASNMARFPAVDGATTAKVNRFVFRKNRPESGAGSAAGSTTPAAGGSPVHRQPPAR
jgi:hypothetical protein